MKVSFPRKEKRNFKMEVSRSKNSKIPSNCPNLLPEGKFDQLDRVGCNFVSNKREVLAAKDFYWLARGGQQSLEFNRSPFVATAARKRRRKENAASVRLLC